MPFQSWRAVLNAPGTGAGTPLANSAALTDISPAPQLVLPAGYLYPNQRLRITAYGIFSSVSAPTLLLGVYYGGVAGTLLAATAANTIGNGTNWPWQLWLDIYVRTVGSSGTVWCNGQAIIATSLTQPATPFFLPSSQTQPITVNTTTANAITVGAQWGTGSSSNTITCEDAYVEALS
jgi:hypothetical protein